jgi:transcriptional regulator with XRE-family HTH domain
MQVGGHRSKLEFHGRTEPKVRCSPLDLRKVKAMILNELPAARADNVSPEPHRPQENITAMPLDALRDAKQLTQVQMAQLLKISQGAVSKVERRTDMFVSTLRNYVRAIGGDLEIRAVFPDGDVLIDQFSGAPRKEQNGSQRPGSRREENKSAPRL